MNEIDTFLTCRVCGYRWQAGVHPADWPARGLESPEKFATRPFCERCQAPPPHLAEFIPRVSFKWPSREMEQFVCGVRV